METNFDLKSNPLPRQIQRVREICVANGDTFTPPREVYPSMFPFFKEGLVVFCNVVSNPIWMAEGLQLMLDDCGLSPERKQEMIHHILSSIANPPVDESEASEESANETQVPEEATDNVST